MLCPQIYFYLWGLRGPFNIINSHCIVNRNALTLIEIVDKDCSSWQNCHRYGFICAMGHLNYLSLIKTKTLGSIMFPLCAVISICRHRIIYSCDLAFQRRYTGAIIVSKLRRVQCIMLLILVMDLGYHFCGVWLSGCSNDSLKCLQLIEEAATLQRRERAVTPPSLEP